MQNKDNNQQTPTQPITGGAITDKEKEVRIAPEAPFKEIVELEPAGETAKYIAKIKGEIKLPADLKKMGVRTPAAAIPVSKVATTSLSLPLSDDQIALGLHAQVLSSLRWLAEWCLRQLKKAHLGLKKVHGRFVRVKD